MFSCCKKSSLKDVYDPHSAGDIRQPLITQDTGSQYNSVTDRSQNHTEMQDTVGDDHVEDTNVAHIEAATAPLLGQNAVDTEANFVDSDRHSETPEDEDYHATNLDTTLIQDDEAYISAAHYEAAIVSSEEELKQQFLNLVKGDAAAMDFALFLNSNSILTTDSFNQLLIGSQTPFQYLIAKAKTYDSPFLMESTLEKFRDEIDFYKIITIIDNSYEEKKISCLHQTITFALKYFREDLLIYIIKNDYFKIIQHLPLVDEDLFKMASDGSLMKDLVNNSSFNVISQIITTLESDSRIYNKDSQFYKNIFQIFNTKKLSKISKIADKIILTLKNHDKLFGTENETLIFKAAEYIVKIEQQNSNSEIIQLLILNRSDKLLNFMAQNNVFSSQKIFVNLITQNSFTEALYIYSILGTHINISDTISIKGRYYTPIEYLVQITVKFYKINKQSCNKEQLETINNSFTSVKSLIEKVIMSKQGIEIIKNPVLLLMPKIYVALEKILTDSTNVPDDLKELISTKAQRADDGASSCSGISFALHTGKSVRSLSNNSEISAGSDKSLSSDHRDSSDQSSAGAGAGSGSSHDDQGAEEKSTSAAATQQKIKTAKRNDTIVSKSAIKFVDKTPTEDVDNSEDTGHEEAMSPSLSTDGSDRTDSAKQLTPRHLASHAKKSHTQKLSAKLTTILEESSRREDSQLDTSVEVETDAHEQEQAAITGGSSNHPVTWEAGASEQLATLAGESDHPATFTEESEQFATLTGACEHQSDNS